MKLQRDTTIPSITTINKYPDYSKNPYERVSYKKEYNMNGIEQEKLSCENVELMSSLEYPNPEMFIDQEELKVLMQTELIHLLSSELLKSKLVFFQTYQEQNMYCNKYIMSAKLNIAHPNVKFGIYENDVYKFNDVKFTENEIKEALMNTFPDKLL